MLVFNSALVFGVFSVLHYFNFQKHGVLEYTDEWDGFLQIGKTTSLLWLIGVVIMKLNTYFMG